MAANSLSSFVVGIGYDLDVGSERAVGASFDRVRKGALGIASGIASAVAGLGAMEMSFAKSDDALSRWADLYQMSTGAAEAWGRVFSLSGSGLPQFQSLVEQLQHNRAGLQAGDAGWIEDWGANQLPPGISLNSSPEKMILALSDWFKAASGTQRINAKKTLGIDAETVSALTEGSAVLSQQLAEAYSKYKVSESDVESARLLNDQLQGMTDSFTALGRAMSKVMRGPLGTFFRGMEAAADKATETIKGDNVLGALARDVHENPTGRGRSRGGTIGSGGVTVQVEAKIDGNSVPADVVIRRVEENYTRGLRRAQELEAIRQ